MLLAEAQWWRAAWDLASAALFTLITLKPRHESRWWTAAGIIVVATLSVLFFVDAVRWWSRFGF